MKNCFKCGFPKPLKLFTRNKQSPDGRGSWCYECNRDYQNNYNKLSDVRTVRRAWLEQNREAINSKERERCRDRREFIDSLKQDKPCLDCGGLLPPFCMDFDHVRGEKRLPLSQMVTYSPEVIVAEIEKCDLVCACCHRIRTEQRRLPSGNIYRQRLMAKLNALKSNPCEDCGRLFQPAAMEFDHVRGTKLACVSSLWSWDRMLDEVKKCELVCACCHRKRTGARKAEAA